MQVVAADDRRVDVPVDVHLGRPEEAHVDDSALQEAEHVVEAADGRRLAHQPEVAHSEREVRRPRVEDARLEEKADVAGVGGLRQVRGEHRQPGADEDRIPLGDLLRRGVDHDLLERDV